MMYLKKHKLDRRNSIMAAVKKELKANNAFIAPEMMRQIADVLDTQCFYRVEVIRDVEAAAKRLRLVNHQTVHSWVGDEGVVEEVVSVAFGVFTVGADYSYEYFDNGNSDGAQEYREEPEFDSNTPFALIIKKQDWCNKENNCCNKENNCCNHDYEFYTIVVYTPLAIIDEEEYVAQKEAELENLCQLRD